MSLVAKSSCLYSKPGLCTIQEFGLVFYLLTQDRIICHIAHCLYDEWDVVVLCRLCAETVHLNLHENVFANFFGKSEKKLFYFNKWVFLFLSTCF